MTDSIRTGSLFSGYGGLDLGIQSVLGGTTAWHCDFDKGPQTVLKHHHPNTPLYPDVTTIDWANVEPVDVITGGSPCQDVSQAGRRAGMRAGTRSGLWASMCDGIEIIRPSLVVWENVGGALSAAADSNVEHCSLCVGDDADTHLRALGRVLGDLAEIGYDAWWTTVRAADAGAPHSRARVFVFGWPQTPTLTYSGRDRYDGDKELNQRPEPRREALQPRGHPNRRPLEDERLDWGTYGPAVDCWERVTGRTAPCPNSPGRHGQPRLAPVFVEWMMGLPIGYVTDVPGLSRNEQLKLLGNGVVPQQAALAARLFLNATA